MPDKGKVIKPDVPQCLTKVSLSSLAFLNADKGEVITPGIPQRLTATTTVQKVFCQQVGTDTRFHSLIE